MADTFEIDIGERMKALRLAQTMTLDDLAGRSGVSRAMISRIERGEASPTAQLLARLCSALGTTLSRFFAPATRPEVRFCGAQSSASGAIRKRATCAARSRPTASAHRSISSRSSFRRAPASVFEQQQFDPGLTQHLWLFEGRLTMTAGDETHVLEAGDCLFMRLVEAHVFHNPHDAPARYAIILNRSKV